jgi:hypothetical protein
MKASTALILVAAVTAPLTVELAPSRRDSSATSFTYGVGGGTYAVISRGCEGNVLHRESRHFNDQGLGVEHEFLGPAVVGVRATSVDGAVAYGADGERTWLWNPYVGLEGKRFGLGAGPVFTHGEWGDFDPPPLSAHVRVGNPRRGPAFTIGLFEGVPAFSSGGMFTAGLSLPASSRVQLWAGVSAGPPYDGVGFSARARVPVAGGFAASTAVRLGQSEGVSESSVSVALTWSAVHRRSVTYPVVKPDSLGPMPAGPRDLR